jgi:monovalent cation:H+ antiporter, CPA1 family
VSYSKNFLKLNTIIECESLFNDATGAISFNVIKGIIFSGVAYSLLDVSVAFIWSMVGAIARNWLDWRKNT